MNRASGFRFGTLSLSAFALLFLMSETQAQQNVFPSTGNVGIGTTTPGAKLSVAGANATPNVETAEVVRLLRPSVVGVKNTNSIGLRVGAFEPGISGRTRLDIGLSGAPGTPNDWGDVPNLSMMSLFAAEATPNVETAEIVRLRRPSVVGVKNTNSIGLRVGAFEPGISGRTRLDVALSGGPGAPNEWGEVPDITVMSLFADGNNGTVVVPGTTRTGVLQITGGSDLAEPFEIDATERIEPGMLVSIDPERPGQLRLSTQAYDRTVAGVISGANGLSPGLTMGQDSGAVLPLALMGRVYALADTTGGPIEPGDLLTTSDIPGHAMKVTDYAKAQGAIIGKAMSSLEMGRGTVLALVSLQ